MRLLKLLPSLLIGISLIGTAAQAQESGTLKKIKDTGTIILGVRDFHSFFLFGR
jgi:glutamate/aspartate transport system substrate-binding protein